MQEKPAPAIEIPHVKLNNRVTIGTSRPNEIEIEELVKMGFKSLINLRTELEQDMPLTAKHEGALARQLGLHYWHFPVSSREVTDQKIDEFRNAMAQLPTPVFVHSHRGKRSGLFGLLYFAVGSGLTADETVQKAREWGFQLQEFEDLIRDYVIKHVGVGKEL